MNKDNQIRMNKNKHLVSIITPCFNGTKYIESTSSSVLNQTYDNWEWIIVDDCSSDDSLEMLNKLSNDNKNIKVYKMSQNSGSAACRNLALSHVNGDYITFLDIDDLIDPNYIEEQIKILEQGEKVVVSGYRVVYDNGKQLDYYPPKIINLKSMLRSDTMPCLTTMIDRSVIGDALFAEDLRSVEDYPFMLSIIKNAGHAYSNQRLLATYRRNSNSKTKDKTKLIKNFYLVYRKYCKYNPIKSVLYVIRYMFIRVFKY